MRDSQPRAEQDVLLGRYGRSSSKMQRPPQVRPRLNRQHRMPDLGILSLPRRQSVTKAVVNALIISASPRLTSCRISRRCRSNECDGNSKPVPSVGLSRRPSALFRIQNRCFGDTYNSTALKAGSREMSRFN